MQIVSDPDCLSMRHCVLVFLSLQPAKIHVDMLARTGTSTSCTSRATRRRSTVTCWIWRRRTWCRPLRCSTISHGKCAKESAREREQEREQEKGRQREGGRRSERGRGKEGEGRRQGGASAHPVPLGRFQGTLLGENVAHMTGLVTVLFLNTIIIFLLF